MLKHVRAERRIRRGIVHGTVGRKRRVFGTPFIGVEVRLWIDEVDRFVQDHRCSTQPAETPTSPIIAWLGPATRMEKRRPADASRGREGSVARCLSHLRAGKVIEHLMTKYRVIMKAAGNLN